MLTRSVFVVSLPYTHNEWSGSDCALLSQRTDRDNALATSSTGRRLVMKCAWFRSRDAWLAPSTASSVASFADRERQRRKKVLQRTKAFSGKTGGTLRCI